MSKNILDRIEVLTEAAKYIRMSRSFLSQYRMNGDRDGRTSGPRCLRLGRSIRYRRQDLDEWLNSKHVNL